MLCPLLIFPDDAPANRCLFVLLLMTVYWCTQTLPLPITSLVPVVLFPLLGVMDTRSTCRLYLSEASMMFLGGFTIALAVEASGLHQRVALAIIAAVGCSPRKLSLGLFACTAFVSMWISNSAAVAFMVPIIMGVLQELQAQGLVRVYEARGRPSPTTLCYFLGTAFSATIGGNGTLIGTGTSMIAKGVFERRFPAAPPLAFNSWLFFGTVHAALCLLLTWLYLQWLYMGLFRGHSPPPEPHERLERTARAAIQRRLRALGPLDAHQASVGVLFCLTVAAYLSRDPGFVRGWGSLFHEGTVRDATVSLVVVTLLFVLPRKHDWLRFFTAPPHQLPRGASESLVTWQVVHDRMEWGILLLMGSSMALSAAGQETGLNQRMGQQLRGLTHLPRFHMLAALTFLTLLCTEVMSNVTTASIVLPVLDEMAVTARIHPLYLLVPVALSCNFSFLLPVSTAPNALVTSLVRIPTLEIFKAGVGPTVISILLLWALFPTWGLLVYAGLDEFPSWALANTTKATGHPVGANKMF